jgi:hypothetical protein
LVDGKGNQRGDFVNDHGADSRDWGTVENRVAAKSGEITVEGTWQYTGSGSFKTKMSLPKEVEATWQVPSNSTYIKGAAGVSSRLLSFCL